MKKVFIYFIPFFLFFVVQVILIVFYKKEKIVVPLFIGKNWNELSTLENTEFFSFSVGMIKHNKAFEDNYILEQSPYPGALVRKNQKITLVINENKIDFQKINYKELLHKPFSYVEEFFRKNGVSFKSLSHDQPNSSIKAIGVNQQGIVYLYGERDKKVAYLRNNLGKNCALFDKNKIKKLCYSKSNHLIEDCPGKIIIKQLPASAVIKNDLQNAIVFVWHDE